MRALVRHPFICIVLAALLALVCTTSASAQSGMTAEDEARVARFFAPALSFHPDEQFYPARVFAPLGDLSNPTPEDARALAIGTRVRAYLTIPVAQRLRSATVYYRVSPLAGGPPRRVLVEYFFYYLFNPYQVHGGLIPFAFRATHAHDFERLALIVSWAEATSAGGWDPAVARVVAIYPSDHGHDVPDNVWRARADEHVPRPLHVIVELGSHAMAADINENGRFDPDIDMNVPAKFVWGIRDHGATWAEFKPGYMTPREGVELVGPGGRDEDDLTAAPFTYGLAPVSRLTDGIALIARLAGEKGFGHASWTVRLFGETDPRTVVRVPKPGTDPARGSGDAAAAAYEHGFSVGVSNLHGVVSFFGGGRWLVLGPQRLPDLLVDGQAAVNNEGRMFYVVDSFASYRIDYISRLLVGVGTIGDMRRAAEPRLDLLTGAEFRLGHLRVRPLARRKQPLRRTWADLRITYVF